ncbi:hypothetical protein [Serinibacter salmoneus]|uniref:Uncharacterized protein n=1 Tax=Serinibacter salmoneus TaxID=556530 RepID=A0A2A9CXQ1_9MICO|nr:hypothetical protein [Serinibacter salmoneus]PFG19217.1 hypothetical protein ATL40_0774 [Serinibacter salmoneus]
MPQTVRGRGALATAEPVSLVDIVDAAGTAGIAIDGGTRALSEFHGPAPRSAVVR